MTRTRRAVCARCPSSPSLLPFGKQHKYRAKRTSCGLHSHPSKKEARRCSDLQLLEKAGEITELTFQPKFPVVVPPYRIGRLQHICDYVADFAYRDKENMGIVEDCKGVKTAVYRLKKKLVEALYPVKIFES